MQKLIFRFVISLCLLSATAEAQQTGYPNWFTEGTNIGDPKIKGSSTFNEADQSFLLEGAGENIWFRNDEFYFLWRKIEGDFILSATVNFIGEGVEAHRKIGIMAREELTANSSYADGCVHGDILTSLQYRQVADSNTEEVKLSVYHPTHIQLRREGNDFYFSAATEGESYKTVSKEIRLKSSLYVGLFICSHNPAVKEQARFSNVRLVIPAKKDFVPYRDYLGSHLEIMDVNSGERKILWNDPRSIQAPNWSRDGKHLLLNSEGKLYRYWLDSNKLTLLNTGFVDQNNNDHVYSADGKQIGISSAVPPSRKSTIFVLPSAGSDAPSQVTDTAKGHSYLHDFSPDGNSVIFTGQRNGQFDIYRIDLKTHKETALTNQPTLDDGPEYSPDGKWIYFNSVRTGTMQIWRMHADGSEQEQLTFDQYNNWFPHPSPDGKWLIYIAFPSDIDPSDHPFYKHVMLRIMPAEGGLSKSLAFIYGGQGTINVPSWSPDGTKVAFISNTDWSLFTQSKKP